MAYSPSDLNAEVREIVAARAAKGWLTSRGWLVTSILVAHPLHGDKEPKKKTPERKAADEFNSCMRSLAVSAAVDTALAQMKHQEEGRGDPAGSDPSLDLPRLPGFTHLRRVYPVRRGGVIYLVPIEQLTDAEITEKCRLYRKAADAYIDHAAELQRYGESRRAAA
jgi:hypothetical protein